MYFIFIFFLFLLLLLVETPHVVVNASMTLAALPHSFSSALPLCLVVSYINKCYRVDDIYDSRSYKNSRRPQKWRIEFFSLIKERIQQRIEMLHIENKDDNKNWVTRQPFIRILNYQKK